MDQTEGGYRTIQPVGDDDRPADEPPRAPVSLKAALRRARVETAERAEAQSELRGAAAARLDLLREQLEPVFAQLPADCDMFDLGVAPGDNPRLFVDMIAFVEPARDRRGFRFLQDTRNGRVLLAESESMETMTQAVADYLARRLIEREKALAADAAFPAPQVAGPPPVSNPPPASAQDAGGAAPRRAVAAQTPAEAAERAMRRAQAGADAPVAPPRRRPTALRVFARLFAFLIEVLGSAAFFGLLVAGGYWLWTHYAR